jgi:hypothetical protein
MVGKFASVILIAATGLATPVAAKEVFPPEVFNWAMDRAIAQQIAKGCREFRFDKVKADRTEKDLEASLKGRGYSTSGMYRMLDNVPKKQAQDEFLKYVQTNNIDMTARDGFCPVGQKEYAAQSGIGRFLKAK